jgi:SAM-dependent methyltransferase
MIVALVLLALPGPQSPPPVIQIQAPYVRTPELVVRAMLRLAAVKKDDVVYDLGCGDGRILIAAAKLYGARGMGIDIHPERVEEARANARKAGVEALVKFEVGDLFDADLRGATVVTLYLLADVNLRLRPKLRRELRPGSRIVSHAFDMGDWKPDREQRVDGARIYLWTIPVSGERTR